MTWDLEFDKERRVACLTFGPLVTLDDMRASTVAVAQMLRDNRCKKILTDFVRTNHLALSPVDVINFPDAYADLGLSISFQQAIVCPVSSPIHKEAELYETICLNRAISVAVFDDRETAFAWLTRRTDD